MSAYKSLYGEHFDYDLSGKRRRFKGDKRWFIQCEECGWEWYPVDEHKAYHWLYENLEILALRAECTAKELRQILGGKAFSYKETIGEEYIFRITLKAPPQTTPQGETGKA